MQFYQHYSLVFLMVFDGFCVPGWVPGMPGWGIKVNEDSLVIAWLGGWMGWAVLTTNNSAKCFLAKLSSQANPSATTYGGCTSIHPGRSVLVDVATNCIEEM